ncbi:MAG: hypothetical protein GX216_04920 [Methanomicrobiales archaeon]|jgi:uncharacterized Zn finger protein|nr:hypothetical protein [Methanomicrobiales archaeon]
MGSWYYFPPSTPRPVKDGVKARSKRGAIGEQWWSKRFIQVLEESGSTSRLQRGKRYARKGQVIGIEIREGEVHADVQGSAARPYHVTIRLKPFNDATWEKIFDLMAGQAIFAAQLLSGVVPHEIEEVFTEAGVSLFPVSDKEIRTDCTCPDWGNPCKHIAAVYYLLAEQFDEDPFLIFALRGRGKEEVMEALRERRTAAVEPAAPEEEVSPCADRFWEGDDTLAGFGISITGSASGKGEALRMLGDAPFQVRGESLSTILAPVYPAAERYARRLAGIPDRPEEGAK